MLKNRLEEMGGHYGAHDSRASSLRLVLSEAKEERDRAYAIFNIY